MKQVRLRRADGAAQRAGDLLVRQLLIHTENQRRSLLRRQLPNGPPNRERAFTRDETPSAGPGTAILMLQLSIGWTLEPPHRGPVETTR